MLSDWLQDDRDDEKSQKVLKELENIDDEADEHDLPFIKIDDDQVARDYGIDDELPCLVYFENEIPSIYHGDLANEEQVLDWLIEQINSDSIEEVTDKILENLVEKNQHVAVIFCEYRSSVRLYVEELDLLPFGKLSRLSLNSRKPKVHSKKIAYQV